MVSGKKVATGLGLILATGLAASAIENRKELGELYGIAKKGFKGYKSIRDAQQTQEQKRLDDYRKWLHKEQEGMGVNRWEKFLARTGQQL